MLHNLGKDFFQVLRLCVSECLVTYSFNRVKVVGVVEGRVF